MLIITQHITIKWQTFVFLYHGTNITVPNVSVLNWGPLRRAFWGLSYSTTTSYTLPDHLTSIQQSLVMLGKLVSYKGNAATRGFKYSAPPHQGRNMPPSVQMLILHLVSPSSLSPLLYAHPQNSHLPNKEQAWPQHLHILQIRSIGEWLYCSFQEEIYFSLPDKSIASGHETMPVRQQVEPCCQTHSLAILAVISRCLPHFLSILVLSGQSAN